MYRRSVLLLVVLTLAVLVSACGRKQKPTPVPTLPNTTVVVLTPTAPPSVPALPKYLPTPAPSTPPAEQPQPAQPLPTVDVPTPATVMATRVEPRVEVVVNQTYAYNGPGEMFVPIAVAYAGEQLVVEERSPDGQWLHVCCFAGRPGWIALKDVRPLTNLDEVPIATNVPTPSNISPLPSPTPGG